MSAVSRFIHACAGRAVTPDSVVQGLALGCAAGALTTVLGLFAFDAVARGFAVALEGLLFITFVFSPLIALIWALGLGLVAAPVWAVLHRLKVRCWSAAMILGALLCGCAGLLGGDWRVVGLMATQGALVGLVVWVTAYRKRNDIVAAFN